MKKLLTLALFAIPCLAFGQSIVDNMYSSDDHADKTILFPKLFGLNKCFSVGIIGGGMVGFDYGVAGFNATCYGVYVDFMGWPRKHANDVSIDKWEDHSQYAFHVGYQIPFHKYKDCSMRLIPMIGYASIKKGYTDGEDWSVGSGGIINKFYVTEEVGGFDYGAAVAFQGTDRKLGNINLNFYVGVTRHTAWIGLGLEFPVNK